MAGGSLQVGRQGESEEDPQERKSRPRGRASGSSGPNRVWGIWEQCRWSRPSPEGGLHSRWPLEAWSRRTVWSVASGYHVGGSPVEWGPLWGAGGRRGLSLVRFPVSRLLTARPEGTALLRALQESLHPTL